ncbi:MAG: FAD-dependent monooxygenase, partial [Bacteroidales bacterium]|nr:FAD-dependent monooxygenase [Bacteroidales bacterium]
MSVLVNLNLSPQESCDDDVIRREAIRLAKASNDQVSNFRIIKRSIDARQRSIRVNLCVELLYNDEAVPRIEPFHARNVTNSPEVIIVGAGPAGLFAGLRLIELGFRPIIFERGKDVSSRKKDVAQLCRALIVDPNSNYCFGEGGAGTFSDGKLFTRSKKRGDNDRILELFCLHGANKNILYEAHPHLGTDKLPHIISSIRESIIASGGVVF